MDARHDPIPQIIQRTVFLLVEIAARHIELAKAELENDLKAMGMDLAALAFAALSSVIAFLFLVISLALFLGSLVGSPAGGFAIVGGALLLASGIAGFWGVSRLKHVHLLDETLAEIKMTKESLVQHDDMPVPVIPPGLSRSIARQHDGVAHG